MCICFMVVFGSFTSHYSLILFNKSFPKLRQQPPSWHMLWRELQDNLPATLARNNTSYPWAREMVLWVGCLLCMHDLGLTPRSPSPPWQMTEYRSRSKPWKAPDVTSKQTKNHFTSTYSSCWKASDTTTALKALNSNWCGRDSSLKGSLHL